MLPPAPSDRKKTVVAQSHSSETKSVPLSALLYVSRVAVEPDRLNTVLNDILTSAIARNTAFDVTGLLIATPAYFGQFMEGPNRALDVILDQVHADRRHCDVRINQNRPVFHRLFESWRLMRFEQGSFEERHVTPILERAHRDGDARSTEALMHLIQRLQARPPEGTLSLSAQRSD